MGVIAQLLYRKRSTVRVEEKDMASFIVTSAADDSNNVHPKILKRSSTSGFPTSSHGSTPPQCVCAPATHARSFKCRLHRANPNGHSHQPARASQQPSAAMPSRTVEAL